jgi:hypothetical protein
LYFAYRDKKVVGVFVRFRAPASAQSRTKRETASPESLVSDVDSGRYALGDFSEDGFPDLFFANLGKIAC